MLSQFLITSTIFHQNRHVFSFNISFSSVYFILVTQRKTRIMNIKKKRKKKIYHFSHPSFSSVYVVPLHRRKKKIMNIQKKEKSITLLISSSSAYHHLFLHNFLRWTNVRDIISFVITCYILTRLTFYVTEIFNVTKKFISLDLFHI